jgi:hypothetical protein
MDDQPADDDDDAAEVAKLVAKLREGYDKRHSIALDIVSKESILSLRQHVLEEAGDRLPQISGQITSLISTSTLLKMVGYHLRAMLAHRLKQSSQNSCKRLTRETVNTKSPADIAAYPALYELVQHHYPTLASAGVRAGRASAVLIFLPSLQRSIRYAKTCSSVHCCCMWSMDSRGKRSRKK